MAYAAFQVFFLLLNHSSITYHSLSGPLTFFFKAGKFLSLYWLSEFHISLASHSQKLQAFGGWLMLAPISPWHCSYSAVNSDIFLWGNLIHSATTAPGPLADLSPRERRSPSDTLSIGCFPPKNNKPFLPNSVFAILLDWKQKLKRQITAEKHLIVLMHTSLLNTAALWYCLCCSDVVLFVDLFSLICFLSFDFVRVCLEQCYIREWMACLDGLGWHFFGLYWFSGVCPSGWGRTCICHSCHSHTHACLCEEWAALSPLLFSQAFFEKLGCSDIFSVPLWWDGFFPPFNMFFVTMS